MITVARFSNRFVITNQKTLNHKQKTKNMLPYAYYLLKVIICSGVLFGYYWLLLRNKIFHGYNRFYLLATVVLSLVLPLIQINIWQSQHTTPQSLKLLAVVTSSNEYMDEIVLIAKRNRFTAEQFIWLAYFLTCLVFAALFILVLIKISNLLKHHQQRVIGNVHLVGTTAKGTPFSFLKYIFWNNNIDIATTTGNQIFKHELVHVQQKHSYDKLSINALLIFCWCNPFFWLIRKELNMIHEFIADKIAVEDSDTEVFAAMILQATYPQFCFPLTNSFFYSPIKRRLAMLTKNKNPKAGYIARILVLPLAVVLFAAFTLKTKTFKSIAAPHYAGKKITVVIDAGHGGKDLGATSPNGKITEKDLTLSIAKKIMALNADADLNIILTRDIDVYQTPTEKVDFSKSQHPDLFISVHVDNEKNNLERSGMSVWVSSNKYANATKSKLFASAIIEKFINDYKLTVFDGPMQRTKGIFVLQEEECPAVLIEAGFINNKKDVAYLQSDEGKETIAKNILAAIEKYAAQNNSLANVFKNSGASDTVPVGVSRHKEKVIVTGVNLNETDETTVNNQKENKFPEKELYVLNGKIIGSGKAGSNKLDKLVAVTQITSLTVINKKEAVAKYGQQGENGAVEIIVSTKGKAPVSVDKNNTASLDKAAPDINIAAPDNIIFTKVENEARFPGGDSAWKKYLEKNIDPTVPVREGRPQGEYKVIVTFIVKNDGSITAVTTDNYKGSKMAEQCINLIKKGPKWEPAIQNNKVVTAYRKQPITFLIEEQ